MAITSHYSREVRSHLNLSPIWQPGAGIAPGDVGKIEGGVFVRYRTSRRNRSPSASRRAGTPDPAHGSSTRATSSGSQQARSSPCRP